MQTALMQSLALLSLSQALIHGLNRHYYSISISYRKNELEEQMLMNLQKKTWTQGLAVGCVPVPHPCNALLDAGLFVLLLQARPPRIASLRALDSVLHHRLVALLRTLSGGMLCTATLWGMLCVPLSVWLRMPVPPRLCFPVAGATRRTRTQWLRS